jgi:hypothetical protein
LAARRGAEFPGLTGAAVEEAFFFLAPFFLVRWVVVCSRSSAMDDAPLLRNAVEFRMCADPQLGISPRDFKRICLKK